MTDPSAAVRTDVPAWPALAGWFGMLPALLRLLDPFPFRSPMPTVTVLLLAAGGARACGHLLAADARPDTWGPFGR